MAKKKHYVVWNGIQPGIYSSWEECQAQIKGVKQALYKAFDTLAEAERAYASSPGEYIGHGAKDKKKEAPAILPACIIQNALAVDAACSGNPGKMEYRGVWVSDNLEMFHVGPFEQGTNNIGEFLAIVLGLAYLKTNNLPWVLYSDSRTAIAWVKKGRANTNIEWTMDNQELFLMVRKAEQWLHDNTYTTPIYKWETEQWGEIPADFGRK